MFLPPKHLIIVIRNNRFPNGRHVAEKVHSCYSRDVIAAILDGINKIILASFVCIIKHGRQALTMIICIPRDWLITINKKGNEHHSILTSSDGNLDSFVNMGY